MKHPPCGCHVCGDKPPKPYQPCPPTADACCPPPKPDVCPCPPPKPKPCPCAPAKPSACCCPAPKPPKPPKPCKAEGVLLQKILCCEKRNIPCLCTQLCLCDPCLTPPFTLLSVQQSGAQPSWTPLEEPAINGQMAIRVLIPVCAQVCDACGVTKCLSAVVEVDTYLRLPCGCGEMGRVSLFIIPHVRMRCGECCSEDGTFHVQLMVMLEIYLLRPEPCMMRRPEPPCPDLPLYPPPVKPGPPCWPQCPTIPDPCGWPTPD